MIKKIIAINQNKKKQEEWNSIIERFKIKHSFDTFFDGGIRTTASTAISILNSLDRTIAEAHVAELKNRFVNSSISKLKEFNENKNIIYINDLEIAEGHFLHPTTKEKISIKDYKSMVERAGFKMKSFQSLEYVGADPAQGLEDLMKMPLLITDCNYSLIIIDYLVLKEQVGKVTFNQIIKDFTKTIV